MQFDYRAGNSLVVFEKGSEAIKGEWVCITADGLYVIWGAQTFKEDYHRACACPEGETGR